MPSHRLLPLFALFAACPPAGTSSAEVTLQEVRVSGALAGGAKGRFRIELTGPTTSAFDVAITSDPAGPAFPASIQVPAGASVVESEFTPAGTGAWPVTFTGGGRVIVRNVVVTAVQQLYGGNDVTLQAGASTVQTYFVSPTLPVDTQVTISVVDASLVTVPMSVTLPAFTDSLVVGLRAGQNSGSTRMTVSLANGITRTSRLFVTKVLQLGYSGFSSNRVLVGTTGVFVSLNLQGVPSAAVPVQLTSSQPSVASVPNEATFAAGQTFLEVPITVGAAGRTTIQVTAFGETRTLGDFVVSGSNGLVGLNCPGQVEVNSNAQCSLQFLGPLESDTQVTLMNANGAVLRAPMSVTGSAGSANPGFSITGLSIGRSSLSATFGSTTVTTDVNVLAASSGQSRITNLYLNADGNAPGSRARLVVVLNQGGDAERTLTLSSSNPGVVTAPMSVAVGPSQTYLEVPITFVAPGFSVLTASLGGDTVEQVVTVTNASQTYASLGGGRFEVGVLSQVQFSVPQAPVTDTPLMLTNSAPSVIQFLSTPTLRAGTTQVSFVVRALAPGTAQLNLALMGQYFATSYEVVATPMFTVSAPSLSVGNGSQISVSYDAQLAADRVITLSQMGTGAYNMATQVVVGTGSSNASISVTGRTAGDVVVTATQGSTTRTDMATISP